MKTVSIIIPVYNAEAVLPRTLDSVLAQTYTALEILVVNDGSKDRTEDVCEAYAAKDSRVRVFYHENHGVSYTRNRGLREATGDYVMFIDGDDTVSPTWVEAYVTEMERSHADIVVGGMTVFNVNGTTTVDAPPIQGMYGKEIWNEFGKRWSWLLGCVPNKLYRAELVERIRFDTAMTVQEDLDFAITAFSLAERVSIIREVGYFYDCDPNRRPANPTHLLRNQVKMFLYGNAQTALSTAACETMACRICHFTYHCLLAVPRDGRFRDGCIAVAQMQDTAAVCRYLHGWDKKRIVYRLLHGGHYTLLRIWAAVAGTKSNG